MYYTEEGKMPRNSNRSEPMYDSGQLDHGPTFTCDDCGETFHYICGCHPEGPK